MPTTIECWEARAKWGGFQAAAHYASLPYDEVEISCRHWLTSYFIALTSDQGTFRFITTLRPFEMVLPESNWDLVTHLEQLGHRRRADHL